MRTRNTAAIPSTVRDCHRAAYDEANGLRLAIKAIASELDASLRGNEMNTGVDTDTNPTVWHAQRKAINEARANADLAYRHLEDASMRLGKVLQALDGGVSVYDRATTVGAPDSADSAAVTDADREGLAASQPGQPAAPAE